MVDLIWLIHEEIHESADPGRRKGERVREKEVLGKNMYRSQNVYIYRFKKKVGQLGFKH